MTFANTTTEIYLLIKLFDVVTSELNFRRYGLDIEANPIMEHWLKTYGWIAPILFILFTALIMYLFNRRYKDILLYRIGVYTLLGFSLFIVIMNTYTLLL